MPVNMSGLVPVLFFSLAVFEGIGQNMIKLNHREAHQEVAVTINGEHFTSYVYGDDLKKPVLYPIFADGNIMITRGYPLYPKAGERVDHPHHLGHWLNYGDVNGFDFWNNSSAVSDERRSRYGEVRHQEIVEIKDGEEGFLTIAAEWQSPKETLLDERTTFRFSVEEGVRVIDRFTTLVAREEVSFTDNKEGMIAIRVTRALELPSDGPVLLTDSEGNPMEDKVVNNDGVSGDYLSGEGVTGEDVWGTRSSWMRLAGEIDNENVAVVIIDHPDNVGYPTYWHARPYGLFAANPLGQSVFTKGKKELNFSLEKGEAVTFRYRMLISSGDQLSVAEIEGFEEAFSNL